MSTVGRAGCGLALLPGLGAAQDLLALAFTLPAGTSSPQIFEVDGKLALMQVTERHQPTGEEIAAAAAELRAQLLEGKRRGLTDAWLSERRSELAADGQLSVNTKLLGRGES
jgi:hypothetical protein